MLKISLALLSAALAPAPSSLPIATAIQVTHDALSDPSFAPDGRRMVAVAYRDGREQLAIARVDGASPRLLTSAAFDHEDPAWSPDGRLMAHVSKAGDSEVIHLIRPDGGGDRALTPATRVR